MRGRKKPRVPSVKLMETEFQLMKPKGKQVIGKTVSPISVVFWDEEKFTFYFIRRP